MIIWSQLSLQEKAELRKQNNPNDAPVGDYTGRCSQCESDDLWDDNLHYGCNRCDFIRFSDV